MSTKTSKVRPAEFNTRRFKYKLHMIIHDEKGKIIKDKKYCSAVQCAAENVELLRNRQIVNRIVNGYKFSEFFTKYDCVTIIKINEKIKSKVIQTRVLI
jgi:hypothetical protein